MSSFARAPFTLSPADLKSLRCLATAWGTIISASWFVPDDLRLQLLTLGAQLAILAGALLAIYLLRRWENRC